VECEEAHATACRSRPGAACGTRMRRRRWHTPPRVAATPVLAVECERAGAASAHLCVPPICTMPGQERRQERRQGQRHGREQRQRQRHADGARQGRRQQGQRKRHAQGAQQGRPVAAWVTDGESGARSGDAADGETGFVAAAPLPPTIPLNERRACPCPSVRGASTHSCATQRRCCVACRRVE
jgi:hypothetical protein